MTFYPIGNADCCKIDLSNGKKLLFDYACMKNNEDENDLRIDLQKVLNDDLKNANRKHYDVVAFTHADDDHIHGFSDFFFLEHDKNFQDSNRIKIQELWVPAAIITETGLEDESLILRSEARFRLKNGKGIRVFSRPERLEEWLKKNGLTINDRKNLITDAGQLIPGFDITNDGVEFFVHSPFAFRMEDRLEDRNEDSLILHTTFNIDGHETKAMIIGDSTFEVLRDIVNISKNHNKFEKLQWDIYDIPHHCSYLALSDDKGKDITDPIPEVEWLLSQGGSRGKLISCSDVIPDNDKNTQPPHRQAANYYKEVANKINGEFIVTMEYPQKTDPKQLTITIDKWGATIQRIISGGGSTAATSRPPRAG